MLTVFIKPTGCSGCDSVKRWLRDPKRGLVEGVDYEFIDATDEVSDKSLMADNGFMQVPASFVDGKDPFLGFEITRLQSWYDARA